MIYPVYITQNGSPKTGLSPDFESLLTLANDDFVIQFKSDANNFPRY